MGADPAQPINLSRNLERETIAFGNSPFPNMIITGLRISPGLNRVIRDPSQKMSHMGYIKYPGTLPDHSSTFCINLAQFFAKSRPELPVALVRPHSAPGP